MIRFTKAFAVVEVVVVVPTTWTSHPSEGEHTTLVAEKKI